jgi:AraC family transcriptional regulator of adaptative response / DNA-3-methyladenine glycosylase II
MALVNGHIECKLGLQDLRDLAAAVQRCRRLMDLDVDTNDVDEHLKADPLLEPLVQRTPGLRVPGAVDGAELAIRAVLGQQVSVAAARTTTLRLTSQLGEALPEADGGLTHLFPSAQAIANADPETLPGPRTRRQTLHSLSSALASGEIVIDAGSDREDVRCQLFAIAGIGSWTTEYIAMRALADPDAFLPTDLAVRRALAQLGKPSTERHAAEIAERWRPWRAYALQHLWATQQTL